MAENSRACLIHWIDFPEIPFRTHVREILKCGRSALVVRADVAIGGRVVPVAYKRFSRRNLWKVVAGAFRRSRASRAWRLGHLLRELGIRTPLPLVAITPRRRSQRVDSYLATEYVAGFPLHDVTNQVTELPPDCRAAAVRQLAEDVGRLLGRLHAAGFRHRDLKAGNILIEGDVRQPQGTRAVLIDLDGVSRRRLTRTMRLRDLSRLGVCFGPEFRPYVSAAVRFVRAYLATCGDATWHWRACWRALLEATAARSRQREQRRPRAA